jgi:hypothetical protein
MVFKDDYDPEPPRSHEQRRIDALDTELAAANKILADDYLHTAQPLEVFERAYLRKTTIDAIFARHGLGAQERGAAAERATAARELRAQEEEATATRVRAEREKQKLRFRECLATDMELRAEIYRRNLLNRGAAPPKYFGQLPGGFPDDFRLLDEARNIS